MKLKQNTLDELVELLEYLMIDMYYRIRTITIKGKYVESYKLYGYLSLHDVEAYQLTKSIVEVIVDGTVYHIKNKELGDKVDWFVEILSDTIEYVSSTRYD